MSLYDTLSQALTTGGNFVKNTAAKPVASTYQVLSHAIQNQALPALHTVAAATSPGLVGAYHALSAANLATGGKLSTLGNTIARDSLSLLAPSYEGVSGTNRAGMQTAQQNFQNAGLSPLGSKINTLVGGSAPYFIPGAAPVFTGLQLGSQLGGLSEQPGGIRANYGQALQDTGNAALNLIPSAPTEKLTRGLTPGVKYLTNAGIAGGENVLRGQGSSLIETGKPNTDLTSNLENFAVGAGLHTVTHPGEALAGAQAGLEGVAGVKKPGFVKLTPSAPSDVQNYVQEQVAKQHAASEAENPTGLGSKVKQLQQTLKSGFVDSQAAIEDLLTATEKKKGLQVLPSQDVRLQQGRVRRSAELASQFIHDNGLAAVIQHAPDLDALNQYLIARHAPSVEKAGFKTGRNAEMDARLVRELGPTYEPFAKQVDTYTQKYLDYAVQTGLISKDVAQGLKEKYGSYVPFDRIFSSDEQALQKPPAGTGKGAMASQGSQTAVRSLKGSSREISNPIETLLSRTKDVFQQGERNQAAQMVASYKDLPGNPFGITPLRTAEQVKERINLFSQAKELLPVQRLFERLAKTRLGWQRNLESEINKLNRKGLYLSLKEKDTPSSQPVTSSVKQVDSYKKYMTIGENGDKFAIPELTPTTTLKQKYAVPTKREFKSIINSLVNTPRSDIEAIKSRIATRENKLGPVLDQIAEMSDLVQNIKEQRSSLIDEGRALADANSRGKSIITAFNDGIKEIYEVNPEIATAAKNLNKQQLGLLGQILGYTTRIFKVGTTGLRVPFAVANLAKDQVTAFINSDRALSTSIANPEVFMKGFTEAIGKGQLFQEMQRAGGGGTSLDLYRNSAPETVAKLRAQKNLGTKTLYTVTHPAELFRAAENAINITEQATRLQQYAGTKEALLSEGRTEADATRLAAKAARENTTDFAKSGSYGQVLNSTIPYLNAGIQGSRTFLNALQRNPAGVSAKLALTVFTPILMATLYNTSDPERKKAYDDIADYEKEGNIVIVPPHPVQDPQTGKWNVIKVPLSQEIANLANIVRRYTEAAQQGDPVGIGEVANNLFQTTTSLNPDPRQALSQLTPQILKAPIEAATNQNLFTGSKIIPDSLKNLPPELQYKDSTSEGAKLVGKVTGVSPLVVNNTVNDVFGGLGTDILNQKNPVTSTTDRFTQATGGKQLDKIYSTLDQVNQDKAVQNLTLKKNLTIAFKSGNSAQISEAISHVPFANRADLISTVESDLSTTDLNKVQKLFAGQSQTTLEALAAKDPSLIPLMNDPKVLAALSGAGTSPSGNLKTSGKIGGSSSIKGGAKSRSSHRGRKYKLPKSVTTHNAGVKLTVPKTHVPRISLASQTFGSGTSTHRTVPRRVQSRLSRRTH